jgi:hypothetical protein
MALCLRFVAALSLLVCGGLRVFGTGAPANRDECDGHGVRPVILVPGYTASPLYDSAQGYRPVWPIASALGNNDSMTKELLALPLTWRGLKQDTDTIGPERAANDTSPQLDGLLGQAVLRAVRNCTASCISAAQHFPCGLLDARPRFMELTAA